MQEMKPIKEGKVREIYDNGDSLIMVATDRISCFDVILNNVVTKKGTVLTQMSKFWFEMTEDILPNHMISTDVKDMPEYFQQDQFDGNSMMCRKLDMLPLECIVRGYITGSGWESYKKTGKVCGIELPEGLKESDKLPEPIYTPSTKAEIGEHDQDISKEEILAKGLVSKEDYEVLEKYTMALFKRGTEIAKERGLILVDTKYEFGHRDGKIYLIDEIHTPDSSRYFYSEGYEDRFAKGEPQKQLSKEFVREWLMENGFQGKSGQKVPEMTPEIVEGISNRYIELFEHITGETFVKGETDNLLNRIEKNVTEYLQNK